MTAARLPEDEGLVPLAQLRRRDQRFRCPVLELALVVDSCVARQAAADPARGGPVYPTCAACELGRAIAANTKPEETVVQPPPSPPSPARPPRKTAADAEKCRREGCTARAVRNGRSPGDPTLHGLCVVHRAHARERLNKPPRVACRVSGCADPAAGDTGTCWRHRNTRTVPVAEETPAAAGAATAIATPPSPDEPVVPTPRDPPGTDLSTLLVHVMLRHMLEDEDVLRRFVAKALGDPFTRRHLLAELARDLTESAYAATSRRPT